MTKRWMTVIWVVVLAVASFGGSVVANHVGTTVYVDAANCPNSGDGSSGDPFCTIQDAVAHANPGDSVEVAEGTYVEAGQIVIDKNLTVSGAGMGLTVVMTDRNTSNNGDARGWFLINSGVNFQLSSLTLDGDGFLIWQAMRFNGFGAVDSVHFTNIKYQTSGSPYAGTGIAAFGNGPVDVSNSQFDEIGRIGLQYFGSGVNGSVANGNTFVGKGVGDWLDYGIEVGAGADITATNNIISGNRGVASSDGSSSAGILVTTFFGPGSAALLENNDITDNTIGVAVGFNESDTSDVEAHFNNITGNGTGVSSTGPEVNATCNWWGDESGPFNATNNPDGTGDPVDDEVAFNPWLTSEAPAGACNGPLPPQPETMDDCKKDGWMAYSHLSFKNQGDCVSYVRSNSNSSHH